MCGGGGVRAWSGDVSIHCVISFFCKDSKLLRLDAFVVSA